MRDVKWIDGDVNLDSRASRLPLLVRTARDVETLKSNSRAVRKLPRAGLEVSIPDLHPVECRRLEQRLRSHIRSCGCAEGAAAALIGLLLVGSCVAIQVWTHGPQWIDVGMVIVGALVAVLLGGLGKLIGVAIARLRFEYCCSRILQVMRTAKANLSSGSAT